MPTIRCPHCRAVVRSTDFPPGQPITCPECELTFAPPAPPPPPRPAVPEQKPARREQPEPLPLDEDEPAEAGSRAPVALLAGVGLAVVLAAGGVGAWFAFGRAKPQPQPEVAKADPPAEPAKPAPKEPPKADPAKATPAKGLTATDPPEPKSLTGDLVYKRLLKSTVYIFSVERRGTRVVGVSGGSGVLVHRDRGLVVTNYHVVREKPEVDVYFPAFDRAGELITDPAHYTKTAGLRAKGTVVVRDPRLDLAVLEVERDRVPDHAVGLPLANRPAPTGVRVYSIGASGVKLDDFTGALWRLSDGTVRGRYKGKMAFRDGQVIECTLLENSKPVNPGDSGGPTVNDRCELVGVVSSGDTRADLVRRDIDLVEVRGFLTAYAARGGWAWDDHDAAPTAGYEEPETVGRLIAQMRERDAEKRLDAVRRLRTFGPDGRAAFPAVLGLFDDPDPRVARAAADVIDRLGPPAPEDVVAVEAAVRGKGRGARLYAMRFFTKPGRAVPEAAVPAVVAALADASAEYRLTAVKAVANYGAGAKPAAFAPLLERTTDPDPEVAAEAKKVLATYAPFAGADREVLAKYLLDPKPELQVLAIGLLSASAPEPAVALAWFRPRLSDPDPRVQVAALAAVGKLGPGAKEVLPAVLIQTGHADPVVATAAIAAVPRLGGGAEAVRALAKLLKPGTAAAVREAAAAAVLAVEPTDADTDLPALTALLGAEQPETRAAALGRIGKYGAAALPAADAVAARLADDSPEVKAAALKVVGGLGADAADAIQAVAKLLGPKEKEAVQVAAAGALARLGPKAVPPLSKALGEKLTKAGLLAVCEALAGHGKAAQSAGPALLDAVLRQPDLNGPAVGGAVKVQGWEPDPAAAAVVKVGGDDAVKQLIELSQYAAKPGPGGVQRDKRSKYGDGIQRWAILTLGRVDPATLTPKGKALAADRLLYLAGYDPDPDCKQAARLGQTLHPAPKK